MGPQNENSGDEATNEAESRYRTCVLLGLVAISVFVAGLAIYGPGKFGWPVVVFLLAYVLHHYGPLR